MANLLFWFGFSHFFEIALVRPKIFVVRVVHIFNIFGNILFRFHFQFDAYAFAFTFELNMLAFQTGVIRNAAWGWICCFNFLRILLHPLSKYLLNQFWCLDLLGLLLYLRDFLQVLSRHYLYLQRYCEDLLYF